MSLQRSKRLRRVDNVFSPMICLMNNSCCNFISSTQYPKRIVHKGVSSMDVQIYIILFNSTTNNDLLYFITPNIFLTTVLKAPKQACKYRTKSKKLLQNKNQLQRIKKLFLWYLATLKTPRPPIKPPLHSHTATFRKPQSLFRKKREALLQD